MSEPTQETRDAYAFAESIRQQASRVASLAGAGRSQDAALAAMEICSQSVRFQRKLLGQPEPDPTIDYDEDCHWDGTPRLPGEPRREKGEAIEGLDLGELNRMTRGEG
jgi:hypothetical protein